MCEGVWKGPLGVRQGGKKARRSRVHLRSRRHGDDLGRRSGWRKNLSHLSPVDGCTGGRRKPNLGRLCGSQATVTRLHLRTCPALAALPSPWAWGPGFHSGWGLVAARPSSPLGMVPQAALFLAFRV